MAEHATPPYRFGDLLALARLSWTQQMAEELASRGHADYRVSDAACMRLLLRGPLSVGELGKALGITRQAARKVAQRQEQRGYSTAVTDAADARRINVVLTEKGRAYAHTVVDVIAALNASLADRVDAAQLMAADTVLRASISSQRVREVARRIPRPIASPLA